MVLDAWLQAYVHKFVSPLDPQAGWPGCYINVRCCGELSMVPLQLRDPLELFVKRNEFLSCPERGVSEIYESPLPPYYTLDV